MTGFTVKMLVSYRKWRETAERMGWGTSPANHGQKVNPAEDTSDTIRERIASNCPWYYTLEEILHGGDLEAREPVRESNNHVARSHDRIYVKVG